MYDVWLSYGYIQFTYFCINQTTGIFLSNIIYVTYLKRTLFYIFLYKFHIIYPSAILNIFQY